MGGPGGPSPLHRAPLWIDRGLSSFSRLAGGVSVRGALAPEVSAIPTGQLPVRDPFTPTPTPTPIPTPTHSCSQGFWRPGQQPGGGGGNAHHSPQTRISCLPLEQLGEGEVISLFPLQPLPHPLPESGAQSLPGFICFLLDTGRSMGTPWSGGGGGGGGGGWDGVGWGGVGWEGSLQRSLLRTPSSLLPHLCWTPSKAGVRPSHSSIPPPQGGQMSTEKAI